MSAIFAMPVSDIGTNASPENIKNWDSLKHISLITALEEEFEIQFEDDEIVKMLNFNIIMDFILNKVTT